MKDTFLSARLVEKDLIRLSVFSMHQYEKFEAKLIIDDVEEVKLASSKFVSTPNCLVFDYRLDKPLALGHNYTIALVGRAVIPLDLTEVTTFEGFEEEYFYNGDDLGASYTKPETKFAIWAPVASSVTLRFRKRTSSRWHYRPMDRSAKGVYRVTIKGDMEYAEYQYVVVNSGVMRVATDPYAKASSPNGESSVVLDMARFNDIPTHEESLPKLDRYVDAIIYEGNVRDLTISPRTDIENKGTFKALYQEGAKTKGGNPAGFDYIKSLGITHLQLLPIFDFKTVDELHPGLKYNWGYDPQQYMVPEGSYASDVLDPECRIRECKEMVSKYHEAGIRIVMDVVFNHVYDYVNSSFEKIVPNYYFRKKANSKLSNCSGCGNDLATEKPMVRKLILDSCKWWIDMYRVDGFRFDLMGLIDIDTLNSIKDYARSVKKDFMLYGEGWNMDNETKAPLGKMENAKLLKDFAFFNDLFREYNKAYLTQDYYHNGGYKYALMGSSLTYSGIKSKWEDASQSINYIECHDNGTFFDYIGKELGDVILYNRLQICTLGLLSILISNGVPFIHAGQEVGISKYGKDNTYNAGDNYNQFPYELVDERFDMVERFKWMVNARKTLPLFKESNAESFKDKLEFDDYERCVILDFINPVSYPEYSKVELIVNPTFNDIVKVYEKPVTLLVGAGGDVSSANILMERVMINKCSCLILGIK
ncbi:MAG: type I pullulanase [Bacilli bacterium]|nr:type I pullulanase [Bacilli bacterium]